MTTDFRPYVEIAGEGEPIVLVHGSWTDHTSWQFAAPALASDHLVVTYDRRGHSRSVWDAPVTRRQDEDDLADLIGSLDRGPVHLVANSYGASISLGLAARRPELVRSVIAHEPPLLGAADTSPWLSAVGRRVGEASQVVVDHVAAGRPVDGARHFVEHIALGPGAWDVMPPDVRTVMVANAPTFVGMLQDPAWDEVPADPDPSTPVLLTSGTDSPGWLPAIVEALAATRYRHADRHVFDLAGHVPHLTHVADYVTVVRRALRAVTERRAA